MTVTKTVQHYLQQHSVEYDLLPHPHTVSIHGTAEAAHIAVCNSAITARMIASGCRDRPH
jgi:hypothetical protein